MIEIKEMRLWLQGRGLGEVARLLDTDRKTVRCGIRSAVMWTGTRMRPRLRRRRLQVDR